MNLDFILIFFFKTLNTGLNILKYIEKLIKNLASKIIGARRKNPHI